MFERSMVSSLYVPKRKARIVSSTWEQALAHGRLTTVSRVAMYALTSSANIFPADANPEAEVTKSLSRSFNY